MNKQHLSEEEAGQLHRMYYTLAHHILPDLLLPLEPLPAGNKSFEEQRGTYFKLSQAKSKNNQADFLKQEDNQEPLEDWLTENEDAAIREYKEIEDALLSELEKEQTKPVSADDEENVSDTKFLIREQAEENEEMDPALALLMAELEEEMNKVDLDELPETDADQSVVDYLSDEELLETTWTRAWYNTDLETLPPQDDYTLERRNIKELEIMLFSFPAPFQMPDVWMAAAIRQPGGPYRYFTLEKSVSFGESETEAAVLGEWAAGGRHYNYGSYESDVRSKEAFIEAAIKKIEQDGY